jgi:hypothetical protein
VAKQRSIQLKKIDVFAQEIKKDALYAVFASALERGGRYYWLLRTLSSGYKLKQGLKVAGATLRKGSWVVDAHWYMCTSDDQERKAYKLLCGEGEATVVPVASMVQEHGVEFMRESRTDAVLKDSSHLGLIEHNHSNMAGVARSILCGVCLCLLVRVICQRWRSFVLCLPVLALICAVPLAAIHWCMWCCCGWRCCCYGVQRYAKTNF